MNDLPASEPTNPTPPLSSPRKAESNRRNARKSTGPKTERGKSWSRRNALKHGILASQAVIATTEGLIERKTFEQLVDGLGADFHPAGTFEQVLVQQIAACIWRQRRLLMFENRAAFQARDNRTFKDINQPQRGVEPRYSYADEDVEGSDVLDRAGLGLDLPSERDTMRLIRYEATITRSLKTALAQLKVSQRSREVEAARAPEAQAVPEDRAVVVDPKALKRNRGREARRLGAKASVFAQRIEIERDAEEEERLAMEEAAESEAASSEAASSETAEENQTKPNIPPDPDALLRHQHLLDAADTVMKLSAKLAPKRQPSGD